MSGGQESGGGPTGRDVERPVGADDADARTDGRAGGPDRVSLPVVQGNAGERGDLRGHPLGGGGRGGDGRGGDGGADGGHGATGAPGMDRRHALKILALAAATPAAFTACDPADGPDASEAGAPAGGATAAAGQPGSNPRARGDAWDPDLLNPVVPWERTLTDDERETLAVLCDLILPADARSPSASALGCHDFIDEWVSAPYDGNRRDQVLVRGGLVWLDQEAGRRVGAGARFRDLPDDAKRAVCDAIRYAPAAAPEHKAAARFFDRVRDLTATAFFTTQEGMADIQYVGNVPTVTWELPPPEVLRHLGLE